MSRVPRAPFTKTESSASLDQLATARGPAVKFAPCEPYTKNQVIQRFEADATFTHVDLRLELRIDAQRGDLFVGDGEVIIERDRAAGKSS